MESWCRRKSLTCFQHEQPYEDREVSSMTVNNLLSSYQQKQCASEDLSSNFIQICGYERFILSIFYFLEMSLSTNCNEYTNMLMHHRKVTFCLMYCHSESPSSPPPPSSSSSSSGENVGSSALCGFFPPTFLLLRCSSLTVRMRMSMASIVSLSRGVEENHSGLLGTQERSGRR